jgi:hypothetical protein
MQNIIIGRAQNLLHSSKIMHTQVQKQQGNTTEANTIVIQEDQSKYNH